MTGEGFERKRRRGADTFEAAMPGGYCTMPLMNIFIYRRIGVARDYAITSLAAPPFP